MSQMTTPGVSSNIPPILHTAAARRGDGCCNTHFDAGQAGKFSEHDGSLPYGKGQGHMIYIWHLRPGAHEIWGLVRDALISKYKYLIVESMQTLSR